jgi:Zn-finger nucleic acid-binding protein
MPETWDDRKRALEEDYFRRKEQEAIEKLRAKREAEHREREAAGVSLICPKCGGKLAELLYEDIEIDRCASCNGVWLDAGELELLTAREEQGEKRGWLGRMLRGASSE